MVVRGGLGEPYCSEECRDKGGKYIAAVMLKNQTGVCGICQKPVQASMYGASNCAVVPFEGVNLFICEKCSSQGQAFLQSYRKCCMCQKPLADDMPVGLAPSQKEPVAPKQTQATPPPPTPPATSAQTPITLSTSESPGKPAPVTGAKTSSAAGAEHTATPRKKRNGVIIAAVIGGLVVCVLVPICLIGGIMLLSLTGPNLLLGNGGGMDPWEPIPTGRALPPGFPTPPNASPGYPTLPAFFGPPTVVSAPLVPNVSWQRITTLPRQVNSFAADPSNPQIVYAGTGENGSGSGVYKSEDRGKTWRTMSKGLPNEDVAALAFSRSAPFTLYAVVGVRGDVYTSSDNGASWTKAGNSNLFGGFWYRLLTLPGSKNSVLMFAPGNSVARSGDGGRTWTPIRSGIPADEHSTFVQSLAFDPSNPNLMYLGTGGFVGGGAGVYKSTDGGANWSPANRGMLDYRITAIAVDPKAPQTIYAGSDAGEFFRSKDGAQTWEDLTSRLPFAKGQHNTIRQIMIDPNNPATIYLMCDYVGVLVTNDGGATWRSYGKPPEGESFYEHGAAAILFGDPAVVLLGDERSGAWRAGMER